MNIPLIVAVPAVLLSAIGAVTAPAPALLTWLGLGMAAGGLTWAWSRFSWMLTPSDARTVGLQVAVATTIAGLALAGSMAVLGAGTLVLLAALSAWVLWTISHARGPRPDQVHA